MYLFMIQTDTNSIHRKMDCYKVQVTSNWTPQIRVSQLLPVQPEQHRDSCRYSWYGTLSWSMLEWEQHWEWEQPDMITRLSLHHSNNTFRKYTSFSIFNIQRNTYHKPKKTSCDYSYISTFKLYIPKTYIF